MATKHEQILSYIELLPVGEKISVRTIAKNLSVSEGTAYRAIKDAENKGLVSTIERVGTIRIERKTKESIESLTFKEVVTIIDGDVLGGKLGLSKDLSKFIIGAMEEEAMTRYITRGSLMIVGNRENAQKLALHHGAAILITGGFKASEEMIELADSLKLPIIGTSYDSFTVATMINRAMTDQLIKKDIMMARDIYIPLEKTKYLTLEDTILNYRKVNKSSKHSRFPIVNKNLRLMGIVSAKDIIGKPDHIKLSGVMTKDPTTVKMHMSVASIGHLMIWDGLEVMPVVEDDLTLIGIISRQDVMKAMQTIQRQPQVGATFEDQIAESVEKDEESLFLAERKILAYSFVVTPQMTDTVGTLSIGVLSELVSNSAKRVLLDHQKKNAVIEQVSVHAVKVIQIENVLKIQPKIFELGRRTAKIDVEVYRENILVAKAIVICQLMQRE